MLDYSNFKYDSFVKVLNDIYDFTVYCSERINLNFYQVPVTESVSSANGYHPPTPVLYPLTGQKLHQPHYYVTLDLS